MVRLKYRLLPELSVDSILPLAVALIDYQDILDVGIDMPAACQTVADCIDGPVAINIIDLDAVTTTSDGIMIPSAIRSMAAADRGKIHPEFGYIPMAEIPHTDEIFAREPHLRQWDINYPGRRLFRGPDVADKAVPVHNVVITGRACNNNSGTEMMHLVTMGEILMPYVGQHVIMTGEGRLLAGESGEHISVGIGMTVAEKFGRVFSTYRYRAGDTAHGSGEQAKTLKRDIPCIVADKRTHAEFVIRALKAGMVPGRDIGCSPVNLSIARALRLPMDLDNITARAWAELQSVDITRQWLEMPVPKLTEEDVLENADEILPGVVNPRTYDVNDVVFTCFAEVGR